MLDRRSPPCSSCPPFNREQGSEQGDDPSAGACPWGGAADVAAGALDRRERGAATSHEPGDGESRAAAQRVDERRPRIQDLPRATYLETQQRADSLRGRARGEVPDG